MLVVGERINTSRKVNKEPVIEAAVRERNVEYIQKLARDQVEAGAAYVDLNCGTLHDGEEEALEWLTRTVQAAVDVPMCFDSPNGAAIERAIGVYDTSRGQPMINSITAESTRYASILPLVRQHRTKVIALAMDDDGIQPDGEKRYQVATRLVSDLLSAGVAADDIFVDPLTFPIGTGSDVGLTMLDVIRRIRAEFPDVHITAGISNVSHGMPVRKILNEAMMVLAMGAGLDSAIIDPLDRYLMALIAAAEAILGRDEFSMSYITQAREGRFDGI